MLPIEDAFDFDYFGSDLRFGRGRVAELGEVLADHGLERALVITGSHVGANPDVMEPVTAGLGDRLAGVHDGTTPEKRAEEAFAGIERMRELDADVLVAVGGGSSLDVARQTSVFHEDGRTLEELKEAAREGTLEDPDPQDPTPLVVVPTTFAGADVSSGGSIEVLAKEDSPTGQPIRTSGPLMPIALLYDPALFETTPMGALSGSAMNGFNKGIETLYARNATPITDGTAIHGLRLLTEALPRLAAEGDDPDAMDRAVVGIVLVQYRRRTSIVHAFGHGFSRRYDLQQGMAHAICVPHVLRYLFQHVDAGRALLAEGLEVDAKGLDDEELGEAVVAAVEAVRDSLGLPARIRELDPVGEDELHAIAELIHADAGLVRAPEGLDPTVDELEGVLREAW